MLMQAQGVGDGTSWLRVAEHEAAPWLPLPQLLFPLGCGSRAGWALLPKQGLSGEFPLHPAFAQSPWGTFLAPFAWINSVIF